MTTINNENQDLERELTSEELESIAGGMNVWDRMAKLGGVMHGRPEPNSIDLLGEVGGRVAQGGYTVAQAFKGAWAELTGDLGTAADVQKNTMSRGEQVYQDVKDSPAGKILGGVVLVVGTSAAGGAISSVVRTARTTTASAANPISWGTTPSPSIAGAPQQFTRGSIGEIVKQAQREHWANGGSFSSMPRTESVFSYNAVISGLQVNQRSSIGEQLVEKSAGQFLSEGQLKQFNIPADARVVGYVGAKEADADFVKEFKTTLGLDDNAKLGYLQVSWSHNGSPVRDVVPMIEMNDAQITANEPKKEELTTPQSSHLSRNRFYHPH
ncbi:hypothetical protein Syn6312_1724 [Synechococcus sp. PCC 6312]|nr:hypothetical protein Syn6312_1724 [Synechococcus sp. PCC 6312]